MEAIDWVLFLSFLGLAAWAVWEIISDFLHYQKDLPSDTFCDTLEEEDDQWDSF